MAMRTARPGRGSGLTLGAIVGQAAELVAHGPRYVGGPGVPCRTEAMVRHAAISTTMISMRHVRRTDGATALSRPSRLQMRSGSRADDDVRAASDPPGG
jgi:hypothetical protein